MTPRPIHSRRPARAGVAGALVLGSFVVVTGAVTMRVMDMNGQPAFARPALGRLMYPGK